MALFIPQTTTTTVSLFLLLATTLFSLLHAAGDRGHGSLVLGLTHVRAVSPPRVAAVTTDMIEPLRGFRDGYLISLNLGTPPQVIPVYMDTGSDLTWVPCGNISFECMDCDDYRHHKLIAAFSPSYSSSSLRDLCTSPLCADVHSSDNPYDPCAVAGCSISTLVSGGCPRPCPSFSYTYGAGGLVVGSLTRDTLRVHTQSSAATREVASFCFGCVGSTFREPIGIAGFGKGALSLPSQLGFLRKGFSHCFLAFKYVDNPNFTSPLVVGSLAISSKEYFLFTPMLKSPTYPNYYYIGLEGISIGNDTMAIAPSNLRSFDPEGNGGMLIDSGTTYTHLPEPFYSLLLSKMESTIVYTRSNEYERRTGVKLSLPKDNCFYAMSAPRGSMVVKCFLFQIMDDGGYGPAGVFGSFQQQNMEVVYDLEKERIGFQPMDCASSAARYGLHQK
ncbi:probable aspartyl protease At4g16563 isoform X2 [Musa acuminata AAA Group]|uniref:probable aspartyl protease At4g16563 isoform X2 n=1 Tax=Musa acuminata AAA Group TaxID=214697 RepID=UPI0031D34A9A